MSYKDLLKTIDEDVLGENDWMWVAEDTSAWLGPMNEYVTDHQYKFYQYLKDNKVVVTAGANCGLHVRFFAKKFDYVYAFEPDPLNFHCMVNNAQYDNVIKMMCALGDRNKLIRVDRAELIHCGSHKVNDSSENPHIPMLMLDTLKLDACDLIQLDVEGFEGKVLEGAIETIIKYSPVITMETLQGVDYPDVIKIMNMLAYERVDFTGSDSLWIKK
jgi:FkbM family methyltransferase